MQDANAAGLGHWLLSRGRPGCLLRTLVVDLALLVLQSDPLLALRACQGCPLPGAGLALLRAFHPGLGDLELSWVRNLCSLVLILHE